MESSPYMNRVYRVACSICCRRVLTLLCGLVLSWGALEAAIPAQGNELLQFTTNGHVLGFESDGFYVANGDHMLRVGFAGATRTAPRAEDAGTGGTKAQPLSTVTYNDLWPGVSLRYEAVAGGIVQSTWKIAAGAGADQIRLRYNAPLEINADGGLEIRFEHGRMLESAPVAWQEIDGQRRPVDVAFRLLGAADEESILGFSIAGYDSAHPLLIDPVLAWQSFFGSTESDSGRAIALDRNGNVYVAGTSWATWGTPVNPYSGGIDAYAAKLDSNGVLLWNTFLGSAGDDNGSGIAVGRDGNVHVAGTSWATWGTPVNPYSGGYGDAFVAKLTSNGARLWNTFLGGSGKDTGRSIAVDDNDDVYVAGASDGTWGAPVDAFLGVEDAFAAKLNSNGDRVWNTFIGREQDDTGNAIAVGHDGHVYVAGSSFQESRWPSGYEVFATKLSTTSGALQWVTIFYPGINVRGYAIAVDGGGNTYLAGESNNDIHGEISASDVIAAKLSASGVVQWITTLGNESNYDVGSGVAVDGYGNVYVVGSSKAKWGNPANPYSGEGDAVVIKLESNGALLWNTFIGSNKSDFGYAIAVDHRDNVYVGGTSYRPVAGPATGQYDAFVTKLTPPTPSNTSCTYFFLKGKNGKWFPVCL